jgi:hypothetical protein
MGKAAPPLIEDPDEPVDDLDDPVEPSPEILLSDGRIAAVCEPVCASPPTELEKGKPCFPEAPKRLSLEGETGIGLLPLSVTLFTT